MNSSSVSLQQLQPGDRARVLGFSTAEKSSGYSQKLRALGLLPGTVFEVMREAPLGDPLEIKVRGFNLSVRRSEAACLLVEKI